MSRWTLGALGALVLSGIALAGSAVPGSSRAHEALDLCLAAARTPAEERAPILARGLAIAEAAVQIDDTDAAAHFALFCNLGRHMQLHALSVGNLVGIRRLRKEIDRALDLAPDSVELLTAKGTFLAELPRFLGGDVDEGERLLRRAIAVDGTFGYAHLGLAQLLARRKAREEARAEVQQALATASERPAAFDQETAQALLGALAD